MAISPDQLKRESDHLRGSIAADIANADPQFSAESQQLLKFHGIYQQDDRDVRRERTRQGLGLDYSCMVRASVPGGILTSAQWAGINQLANEFGDGALRLTTRQGVQFHFVYKSDLKSLVAGLSRSLVSTYAACGDVVRNVMATSAPYRERDHERLQSLARTLDARFTPTSGAYWELWLDGEKAVSSVSAPTTEVVEPIYGDTYLPRKFKIGLALPGDNSIDIYSQDVGIVPVANADGEDGAVVLAGGGLGRSHNDPTTFPRLAEPLAWVPEHQLGNVVEAIVTTFRDHGNRDDRKHARLKYVVAAQGIGWLRAEIEERVGYALADPIALPAWDAPRKHLGWHQQSDGPEGEPRWFIGVPVPGGRLRDAVAADGRATSRRTAVRLVLEQYADEIRLTPHQDLLLCGIRGEHRSAVEEVLRSHGVPTVDQLSLQAVSSMACPALPTCGQALGEAERVLPEIVELLDGLLLARGLDDVRIETRMTGCPNGCSRPYVAELGIVGRTKTRYDIWLGGDPAGTRLAISAVEGVPLRKLDAVLGPILDHYRSTRFVGEAFGDWCHRLGVDAVCEDAPTFDLPGAA